MKHFFLVAALLFIAQAANSDVVCRAKGQSLEIGIAHTKLFPNLIYLQGPKGVADLESYQVTSFGNPKLLISKLEYHSAFFDLNNMRAGVDDRQFVLENCHIENKK